MNIKLNFALPIILFLLCTQAFAVTGELIGCKTKNSSMKTMTLNGKVLLNLAFLPESQAEQDETINQAIELQIKHLIGYFRTTHDNGLNMALSSYRKKIEILKKQPIKYGNDFAVNEYLRPARDLQVPSTSNYLKKAFGVGKVSAKDDAILVDYETDLIVADCSVTDFKKLDPIVLPIDPFLSLWVDDKNQRHSRKFDGKEMPEVSNCISSEITSFGHSEQIWFFWSPIEKKKDVEGKTHSCKISDNSRIYQPILTEKTKMDSPGDLTADFFKDLKNVKFYGVFGTISDHQYFEQVDMDKYRTAISSTVLKCTQSKTIAHCLSEWENSVKRGEKEKPVEPGTYYFFSFLKFLYTVGKISSIDILKTADPDKEIQLIAKGRLLDSNVSFEVKTHLGRTTLDYGPKPTPGYIRFLHEAISDGDAISYLGHSGLGFNVSINNYAHYWKQDKLTFPERTKPLWFGIYNCEGFSYFGFDQLKIFKPGHLNLVVTASSGVEVESRLPMSQLFAIDQILAGKKISIGKLMGKYIQTRDFYTELRWTNKDNL
jgi:hypothetical protein